MRSSPPSRGRLSAVAAILVTLLIALPSVAFAAAPLISTSTLPAGQVGTAYSQTLAATDGTAPYTWAITVGALPAGLTLNAATGVISGTPTATGTSSFVVMLSDSASHVAMKALSITVSSSVVTPPAPPPPPKWDDKDKWNDKKHKRDDSTGTGLLLRSVPDRR